jgi:hypothetical protein
VATHVLVDASQRGGLDDEAGLFVDLPAEAVVDGLAVFQDAAGGFPVAVVLALDDEGPAFVVDDDAGDADGVAVVLGHDVLPGIGTLDRSHV